MPSQPQKTLCLKADPNNCGIFSHLLLWRNVRAFLWFRFWVWFGFFVLFSLVLFCLVLVCLFVGGVVAGFFSSHSCCKPPWFHHPEQGMFKAGCNCSEIAEEFGLAFTCRNLDNYSFFKCETFLYQCRSKLHEERQVCDTWWMLLNEYCYMIWGFFTQTWEYTSGFLAFFPHMNYWCFDYAGRSCWPSSSSADLCFALHISAAQQNKLGSDISLKIIFSFSWKTNHFFKNCFVKNWLCFLLEKEKSKPLCKSLEMRESQCMIGVLW